MQNTRSAKTGSTNKNSTQRKNMEDTLESYGSLLAKVQKSMPEHIENMNKNYKINRFRNNEGTDFFSSGVGYVFMTKPCLNIRGGQKELMGDPFLYSIGRGTSEVAKVIQNSLDPLNTGTDSVPFINIITNAVERFETKDLLLKTKEIGETFYGEKLHWGDNYFESIGGDVLTLEFTEYSDLSLTLLHKAWVDYIHAVKLNKVQTHRGNQNDFVEKKIIDYASSIYYFLLDVDGKTIKYYAKYTGVFPTSVPFSAMSFNLGQNEVKKLSIQYQYSFKEDMDPRILDEFSKLTNRGSSALKSTKISLSDNWVDIVRISSDRKRLEFYKRG